MNREEAIRVLKSIKTFYKHIPIGEDFRTAVDFAIKSLNDWTEYSDKLWKNAYERGKAEVEWIPCDERLPSDDGRYLVSFVLLNDDIDVDIVHYGTPLLPMNTNETECGWYTTDNKGDYYIDDIIAWKPLPTPYRAECPQNNTDIGTTKPKSSICTRCENKDFCKETLRIYGLPNMRVEECKEYREKPIPTSLLNSEPTVSHEEAWAEPSVSADSDDLIIKNGKGIQDGLYNIKDGEIFKYKAKGGTVRAYKLVECVSAERVGEWIFKTNIICGNGREGAGYVCSVCGVDFFHVDGMKYCPNCGAKMKGGAE